MDVQRDQAERFALLKHIKIIRFFSEMETAAKQGRPVFSQMMKELRSGRAEGLILHKIDRGARNLREWSDITDLIELGIKVHFVHDSIDLETRGGRLTGDMLAAVAADYVRNLREETIKGIVGRLKQGIWPFNAPLGYINTGKGNPKTIDPLSGSLVRQAFELYATGGYTIKTIRIKLHALGLRTSTGHPLSKNTLTSIFNNPFYYGALILRSTGDIYIGVHVPLISKELFNQVQAVLSGRTWRKEGRHHFLYRGEITCSTCGYRVLGESQKGYIYYRCHRKSCKGTSFREEHVTRALQNDLSVLRIFMERHPEIEVALRKAISSRTKNTAERMQALGLKLAKLDERLNAATDALLDGVIDKDVYSQKRNELQNSKIEIAEEISRCERAEKPNATNADIYLELVDLLRHKTFLQSPHEARRVSKMISSNFQATGKNIVLQWVFGFDRVISHQKADCCALPQDRARTVDSFVALFMGNDVPTSPHPEVAGDATMPVSKQID